MRAAEGISAAVVASGKAISLSCVTALADWCSPTQMLKLSGRIMILHLS